MSMTILIVDDEENARQNIKEFLIQKGHDVIEAGTLKEAKALVAKSVADIILLDVRLPDGYGPTLLEETSRLPARPPIILMTAYGDIDMAVDAMKNGAIDFHQKPIQFDRLEQSIQRASETVTMRRELFYLRQAQQDQHNFILGKTKAMKELFDNAQRISDSPYSVLITGETGTGKEVLAQAIKVMGKRKDKPFVAINCAAIQSNMLEAELFGFEPGAFTSADRRKEGLMEVADGGILFLDEISELPLDMQAKLLRAVEEMEFFRMGGITPIKVDVQIIAASNRNLKQLMANGEFRADLYFRLHVADLEVPPLRERIEDIPELVGFFMGQNNPRLGFNIQDITPQAMQVLMNHDWPGNIRELKHTIERAMLFCDDLAIDVNHLPAEMVKVS